MSYTPPPEEVVLEYFTPEETAAMIAVVLGLHLAMLGLGLLLSRAARVARADGVAVAFASSQKTLAVGLQLASDYHASLLPMITYHAGQLILDTLIADRMYAQRTAKPDE